MKTIIPTGWKQEKLGDIGKVSMCKRIFKHETLSEGLIPFYKISTFGKTADSFIPNEIFEEYKKKYPYPKKGEILISASGTIGRIVVFDGEEAYFQDSNIVWISNPQNKVLNNFLKYVYLKTKWKSTDGGIISRLYNEDLRSIKFLLPSLLEQEKIVEVLETWDSYLEKLSGTIKLKKKVKKGLMQKLLSGKVRLKGFSTKWQKIKLRDACNVKGEYGINAAAVEYANNLPTYLRITDIDENGHFISSEKKSVNNADYKKFILIEGDIVFARTGATVGKTYLYNHNDGELVFAGFLIRFHPNRDILLSYFLKAYTDTKAYWNWVKTNSSRSGQPGINGVEYGQLVLNIPSIKEQSAIASILTAADQEIEALEKKKALIEQQKKFLLNNMITGRIRLPEFIKAN